MVMLWLRFFNHGILQRNFRKMTINFPIIPFIKSSFYNTVYLTITWSIPVYPKHSVINGLHYISNSGWPGDVVKSDITSREITAMEVDDLPVELPESDVLFEEEDMVVDLMVIA